MTTNADSNERRRFPRAPLSILVQYRFDSLESFLSEYSTDISLGGMFIRTQEPKEEGSMLYLQFYLRDGAKLIEGLGRVVRVNLPSDDDSKVISGMGIEFINLDAESKELIEQIVQRNFAKHPTSSSDQ